MAAVTRTLEEMAAQGEKNLRDKLDQMKSSWEAAKSRMISHYEALPFGPTRKKNYRNRITAATWRAPDPTKWRENWTAKMSE